MVERPRVQGLQGKLAWRWLRHPQRSHRSELVFASVCVPSIGKPHHWRGGETPVETKQRTMESNATVKIQFVKLLNSRRRDQIWLDLLCLLVLQPKIPSVSLIYQHQHDGKEGGVRRRVLMPKNDRRTNIRTSIHTRERTKNDNNWIDSDR